MKRAIRIIPKAAPGRYKGKRARRQAVYGRQRLAKALRRIVAHMDIDMGAVHDAYVDALIYGTGAVEIQRPNPMPDIDPMTGQPWAFPFRVRRLTRAEFEAEFPKP